MIYAAQLVRLMPLATLHKKILKGPSLPASHWTETTVRHSLRTAEKSVLRLLGTQIGQKSEMLVSLVRERERERERETRHRDTVPNYAQSTDLHDENLEKHTCA
jgi:hypothetical protein